MASDFDFKLDLSGRHCPWVVIPCKAAMNRLRAGQVLYLVSTDRDSLRVVPMLTRALGNTLLKFSEEEDRFIFWIRKEHSSPRNYGARVKPEIRFAAGDGGWFASGALPQATLADA